MTPTKDLILEALGRVNDPELHRDLVTLGMVHNVAIKGDTVHLTIDLTTPACPLKDAIRRDIEREVKQFLGQVAWGELDYLIIDLPPGTSDVPLTLSQTIPMSATAAAQAAPLPSRKTWTR